MDAPKKLKRNHKGTVTVTVSATGAAPHRGDQGAVRWQEAGRRSALRNGTAVRLTLPKQAKTGKKKLKVSFLPGVGFSGAKGAARKIRVVKP